MRAPAAGPRSRRMPPARWSPSWGLWRQGPPPRPQKPACGGGVVGRFAPHARVQHCWASV